MVKREREREGGERKIYFCTFVARRDKKSKSKEKESEWQRKRVGERERKKYILMHLCGEERRVKRKSKSAWEISIRVLEMTNMNSKHKSF